MGNVDSKSCIEGCPIGWQNIDNGRTCISPENFSCQFKKTNEQIKLCKERYPENESCDKDLINFETTQITINPTENIAIKKANLAHTLQNVGCGNIFPQCLTTKFEVKPVPDPTGHTDFKSGKINIE